MTLAFKNRRNRIETCPSTTFFTANFTWIDLASNPSLRIRLIPGVPYDMLSCSQLFALRLINLLSCVNYRNVTPNK
jgi:hypothetical protein